VKQSRVGEIRRGSRGERTKRDGEGVGAFMEIDVEYDAWDPHVVVGVEYEI
jgi:hypothetical protein